MLLISTGALVSRPPFSLIDKSLRQSLSRLSVNIFSPSLVFSKLGSVLTSPTTIFRLWFGPTCLIINICVGAVLGVIVNIVTKPAANLKRPVIALCSLGNAGNLPFVLIQATCDNMIVENGVGVFGTRERCKEDGTGYAALGIAISLLYAWGFIYEYIRPKENERLQLTDFDNEPEKSSVLDESSKETEKIIKENELVPISEKSKTLNGNHSIENPADNGVAGLRDNLETDVDIDVDNDDDEQQQLIISVEGPNTVSTDNQLGSTFSRECFSNTMLKMKTTLMGSLQPPVVASLAGILVGFIPPLQKAFFSEDAPLGVVTSSMKVRHKMSQNG